MLIMEVLKEFGSATNDEEGTGIFPVVFGCLSQLSQDNLDWKEMKRVQLCFVKGLGEGGGNHWRPRREDACIPVGLHEETLGGGEVAD